MMPRENAKFIVIVGKTNFDGEYSINSEEVDKFIWDKDIIVFSAGNDRTGFLAGFEW